MSTPHKKLNDALGIDFDSIVDDATHVDITDKAEIQKYNERKDQLSKFRQDIKDARSLQNPTWAEWLLKKSAENIMEAQHLAKNEIEDCPAGKNITPLAELSNSLVTTVNAVMDLDREERKLVISKEKNELRRMEIEAANGPVLNQGNDKVIGIGTNDDILKLINAEIDPTQKTGDDNASTST